MHIVNIRKLEIISLDDNPELKDYDINENNVYWNRKKKPFSMDPDRYFRMHDWFGNRLVLHNINFPFIYDDRPPIDNTFEC